ncbi:MAG TPA: hypothetical protein VGV37_02685 [Aliidongia sp.]|uniref:glycine-rich domain-containing protein n=1 Tax=Aliidongia sp. TaxID=1914230 RepID=UPI002DDDBA92|nr:hypothetical protein [Aliidongia sp.]HEV2673418.1 hypothetical protein [Aliidongia sp.]
MDWATAEVAVCEYLAFLAIAAASPDRMVAPTSELCDEAWHAHILHTEAYDRDMRRIFGRPFHHYPADDAAAAWLQEPRHSTDAVLKGLEGISAWAGLNGARAARDVPRDRPLSNAAILGLAIASGVESFQAMASPLHRTAGGDWGDSGCGGSFGSDSDGHSCGGHSCGGASCGGH